MNARLFLLLVLILALPLIPFLLWDQELEKAIVEWTRTCGSDPWIITGGVTAALAVDLFLPIPSSVLSVFCARHLSSIVTPSWLGLTLAAFSIWLGMTLGALSAFLLGKLGGQTLARKWVGEEEFARMQKIGNERGAMILVVLRAVPLFAEAAALALACSGVKFWKTFFVPVALSNLGIALIYCILGSSDNGLPFWAVFLASITIPAVVSLLARLWLKSR